MERVHPLLLFFCLTYLFSLPSSADDCMGALLDVDEGKAPANKIVRSVGRGLQGDAESDLCAWTPVAEGGWTPGPQNVSGGPPMECPSFAWNVTRCANDLCVCCKSLDDSEVGKAYCDLPKYNLTSVPVLPPYVKMLYLVDMFLKSENLTAKLFENVPDTTHLFLASNNITTLDHKVFAGMEGLICLCLDFNRNLTQQALVEAASIPGLLFLSTENCMLQPPPADAFVGLSSTLAYWSYVANLHAYDFDMTAFSALETLLVFRCDHCDMGGLASEEPLAFVEYLFLEYNAMSAFPTTCTDEHESLFPSLTYLDLIGNRIERLDDPSAVCLPSLQTLDLRGNMIVQFKSGTFNTTHFPCLECLYLNYPVNDLSRVSYDILFRNYTFQSSTLKELGLTGYGVHFQDHSQVYSHAFADCPVLENLTLSKNNFRYVDEDRFFELFGDLRALKNLVVVDSELELLFKTFHRFSDLQSLDLSSNTITVIPNGFFDSLENLTYLDLSNNKISSVSEDTFQRHHLKYLGLGQNPYVCDCQLMWFTNWFKSNPGLFFDQNEIESELDYQCLSGIPLSNFSMVDQACMLSKGASIQIIVLCFILISTLTTISLVFRFRWHLRLVLYEAFRGQGDARRRRLQHNAFDFDVFLSYASDDLPWVRQHLMPELEDRLGLKVCIHQRDFIPGKPVVDNIADCVVKSKKIIMVFSRWFALSEWCQFELMFCLSHVMEFDDALIVVVVDDVTSRGDEMTPSMMALLKVTTYIQWADHPDAIQSFWARVGVSLQEIMEIGQNNDN